MLTAFQNVVFVIAAYITIKLALGRATRADFGLVRVRKVGEAVGWALLVYIGFWLITALLAGIFGTPDEQALVQDVKAEDSLVVLAAYAVTICLIAPVVEELFFRGFMFGTLAKRLGPWWGMGITGVVFALGHAPAPAISLIALGVFGVGLCLLYWRTQSIVPCMALHALNNAITFGVTKDLDPAAVRRGRRRQRGRGVRRRPGVLLPPNGGRMRRIGLATLVALGVTTATASAQTPPPAPTPRPPAPAPATATLAVVRPGHAQRCGAHRPLVHRARRDEAVRPERDGRAARVPRLSKKIRVKTLTFKPVNGGAAGVATLKVKSGKAGRLVAAGLAPRPRPRSPPPWPRPCGWTRSSPTPPAAHAARPCGSCRPSSRR